MDRHLIYFTPSNQDILLTLSKGTFFTMLDWKSGYLAKVLEEQSSFLTTFNPLSGRYRFPCLQCGVVFAGDVFSLYVDDLFQGIMGMYPVMADLRSRGIHSWSMTVICLGPVKQYKEGVWDLTPTSVSWKLMRLCILEMCLNAVVLNQIQKSSKQYKTWSILRIKLNCRASWGWWIS